MINHMGVKILGENPKNVTVFDFDGTLTRDDTFISFSRHALGDKRFVLGLIKSFAWLVIWKLGIIKGDKAKEKLYSALFKGFSKREIMKKCESFSPQYRDELVEEINKRKKSGDKVYIVTASLDLWMEKISRDFDVDLICTKTEVNSEDRLTGKFSTSNCYDVEKFKRLVEREGAKNRFYLTVYVDDPEGGDHALYNHADDAIIVEP